MDYGKAFGVGTGGGVALFGATIGYGWVVFGGLTLTVTSVVLIRLFFRPNIPLG